MGTFSTRWSSRSWNLLLITGCALGFKRLNVIMDLKQSVLLLLLLLLPLLLLQPQQLLLPLLLLHHHTITGATVADDIDNKYLSNQSRVLLPG